MKYFETAIEYLFRTIEFVMDVLFSMVNRLYSRLYSCLEWIFDTLRKIYNRYGKIIRYLTLPWGILIVLVYKIFTSIKRDRYPLLIPGMHMIRGGVGGGKSLTSFVLAEYCLEHFGMVSYFTSPVEKPQLSENGKYWYVMHRVIDLNDYYKDGKKVMNYNFKKYPYIHKDERHLRYNPRLNKTTAYNHQFIPEHEDELLMRHDGAMGIYKYSQHMRLDTQEIENLTLMHEVNTKKDIPLKEWLENDSFDFIPTKLNFTTWQINVEFDGRYTRTLYKVWSMKVPLKVLKRFETHAEAGKYAHLKIDYQ